MRGEKTNLNWVKYLLFFVILILLFMLFTFLFKEKTKEDKNILPNESNKIEIANPASVYCIENNGILEIKNDEQGNQYGVCIKNEKECEEWAFFKGECQL